MSYLLKMKIVVTVVTVVNKYLFCTIAYLSYEVKNHLLFVLLNGSANEETQQ